MARHPGQRVFQAIHSEGIVNQGEDIKGEDGNSITIWGWWFDQVGNLLWRMPPFGKSATLKHKQRRQPLPLLLQLESVPLSLPVSPKAPTLMRALFRQPRSIACHFEKRQQSRPGEMHASQAVAIQQQGQCVCVVVAVETPVAESCTRGAGDPTLVLPASSRK
eukprot:6490896-Amphidinium_carterae.1